MSVRREVETHLEGTLRWVQASGHGTAWSTASAPQSGLFGLVRPGATFNSGREFTTITDRGIAVMHKWLNNPAIEIDFDVLSTGAMPVWATASGTTVPMVHLELRYSAFENGATSGLYRQYFGCVYMPGPDTENPEGNVRKLKFRGLGMNGPTASGYLG